MILERFVMLGKTVPESSSDGREMVCSAGYDLELRRLVRIYPLGRFDAPSKWTISAIRLQRNPKDSRDESWQIATDLRTSNHDSVNNAFHTCDHKLEPGRRWEVLQRHFVGSIEEANQRRLSLALIQPSGLPTFDLEWKDDHPDAPQLSLFDREASSPMVGTAKFGFVPRLTFNDEGGRHRLMLRDWGIYERARKCAKVGEALRDDLAGALRINENSSLLVGNLSNQRNAWLIISVLNLKKQMCLFE